MQNKQIRLILLCLGILPFVYWVYKYVNVDLWYDEVYSISHFVLGGFKKTLFNYPLPNNHVFFNFTSQLISRFLNTRDLNQIAEHVYVFRIFQALITLLTAYYSVQIVKRFFKLDYSLLVIPILFTTIPFMNFSLQLRGYNMSSLFLIMIVYHTWAFIKKGGKRDSIFIVVSSALLIYTIPSNIYMLASILIILFSFFIYHKNQNKTNAKTYYKAIILIVLGIGVTITLYLPILKNIIFNRFSSRETSNIFYSLELLPQLFLAFLSKKYLLVILFITGCWFFARKSTNKEKEILFFVLLLFILPFTLSFLHQKLPFQRVFISLSPIFCILITIPIIKLLEKIPITFITAICAFIIPIYCMSVFLNEIKNNDIEISDNIVNKGKMTQDIYQNYYLSDSFNQKETISHLKSITRNKTVILYNQKDNPSTSLYLAMNGVNFIKVDSQEKLEQIILNNETTILLTSFKNHTLSNLDNINNIKSTVVMDKYPITNIIRINKK
tara:strand:+ start:55 stop:1545 length:1491 start_codon:yes stop_codon:yes gene_type:complete